MLMRHLHGEGLHIDSMDESSLSRAAAKIANPAEQFRVTALEISRQPCVRLIP
jgi:hypothetical protein